MSNRDERTWETKTTGDREQVTGNGGQGSLGPTLRKGGDIADRLLKFAAACFAIARRAPARGLHRDSLTQFVRASSSAGANYEEARSAESNADFAHKCAVSAKEVREAVYWLRWLQAVGVVEHPTDPVVREGNELTAILMKSIKTARSRPNG